VADIIAMIKPSLSIINRSTLEKASTEELFKMFESCVTTGSQRIPADMLAEAWGILFTRLYLSAEDLIEEMAAGHGISEERRQTLHEFIRADCKRGGAFALAVSQRGGKIDKAALIMVADLSHVGSVDWQGTTALHMLAEACDKGIRPALIRNAGKTALSETCDSKGTPVLITILSIGDLRKADLLAIKDVFPKDELKKIKNKNRTGKSAHEIYMEASGRLSRNAPLERNKFAVSHAVKDTRMERGLKKQISSHGRQSDIFGESGKESKGISMSQRYSQLTHNPLDNIELIRRQMKRKK
jgi:hypothetical protein